MSGCRQHAYTSESSDQSFNRDFRPVPHGGRIYGFQRVFDVVFADDVIAIKDAPCLVAGSGHCHLLRHANADHIPDGGAAQVSEIIILRDDGCLLCKTIYRDFPPCNGFTKAGELILQADHLITRANSATHADTRLIVCVCKGHHVWKKYYEKEYNVLVFSLLPPNLVELWDRAEAERNRSQTRKGSSD